MNEFDLSQYEQRASTDEVSSSNDVRSLITEVRRLHKIMGHNPPVAKYEAPESQKLHADVAPVAEHHEHDQKSHKVKK